MPGSSRRTVAATAPSRGKLCMGGGQSRQQLVSTRPCDPVPETGLGWGAAPRETLHCSYRSRAGDSTGTLHSLPSCRGAILLDPRMEKCLLVRGWKRDAGWGFPRGKTSYEETDAECAIREVRQLTLGALPLIRKRQLTRPAPWFLIKKHSESRGWSCMR